MMMTTHLFLYSCRSMCGSYLRHDDKKTFKEFSYISGKRDCNAKSSL